MENNENAELHFLGLMRKAGALAMGAEAVTENCLNGKARMVLTAKDASEHSVKYIEYASEKKEIPVIASKYGKNDIGGALGIGECAAVAVCDTGFAISLCEKMGLSDLEEVFKAKLQREKRRKAKKLAGKSKSGLSKRGK